VYLEGTRLHWAQRMEEEVEGVEKELVGWEEVMLDKVAGVGVGRRRRKEGSRTARAHALPLSVPTRANFEPVSFFSSLTT
jgi:hypothetical protein